MYGSGAWVDSLAWGTRCFQQQEPRVTHRRRRRRRLVAGAGAGAAVTTVSSASGPPPLPASTSSSHAASAPLALALVLALTLALRAGRAAAGSVCASALHTSTRGVRRRARAYLVGPAHGCDEAPTAALATAPRLAAAPLAAPRLVAAPLAAPRGCLVRGDLWRAPGVSFCLACPTTPASVTRASCQGSHPGC